MSLLGLFRRYSAERRRRRDAVARACDYLRISSNNEPHQGISTVLHSDDEGTVVRVCYGRAKPPGRAWFCVRSESIEELTFEDVTRYGERLWV